MDLPARPRPTAAMGIVAALAVLQAALGLLRSAEVFRLGLDLAQHGLVLLPLMGALTIASSGLLAAIAALYVAFAAGTLRRRPWARWVGLLAAALNLLLVLNALVQGAAVARALFWTVVPLVVIAYALATGRRRPAPA